MENRQVEDIIYDIKSFFVIATKYYTRRNEREPSPTLMRREAERGTAPVSGSLSMSINGDYHHPKELKDMLNMNSMVRVTPSGIGNNKLIFCETYNLDDNAMRVLISSKLQRKILN